MQKKGCLKGFRHFEGGTTEKSVLVILIDFSSLRSFEMTKQF